MPSACVRNARRRRQHAARAPDIAREPAAVQELVRVDPAAAPPMNRNEPPQAVLTHGLNGESNSVIPAHGNRKIKGENMDVIIVGSGKLAQELLEKLPAMACGNNIISWPAPAGLATRHIVVHAGSGRELDAVLAYCQETGSTLVELSTGMQVGTGPSTFPIVECPNTNILMLKFMSMVARSGHLFKQYPIRLTESHQADKSSTPGTAVQLASSLGLPQDAICSIRDVAIQQEQLQIPAEHSDRHAFHRIEIGDDHGLITLETRVFGSAPYAEGVNQIISAIAATSLEDRHYNILEFIENGWL